MDVADADWLAVCFSASFNVSTLSNDQARAWANETKALFAALARRPSVPTDEQLVERNQHLEQQNQRVKQLDQLNQTLTKTWPRSKDSWKRSG